MKKNMGVADRLIRLLLAVVFAGLYFAGYIQEGILATICWIVGTVFFITALVGYCPLYTLFHLNTAGKK